MWIVLFGDDDIVMDRRPSRGNRLDKHPLFRRSTAGCRDLGFRRSLPRGPKVVPFGGSYVESYKVNPKRHYFGASKIPNPKPGDFRSGDAEMKTSSALGGPAPCLPATGEAALNPKPPNPKTLNPQTPKALNPKPLNPKTLNPKTLNPEPPNP